MKKFADFYEAWQFLENHDIFADTALLRNMLKKQKWVGKKIEIQGIAGIKGLAKTHLAKPEDFLESQFARCLDIDVAKVNPKTRKIDKDKKKNTRTEIWLECGPWVNSEEMSKNDKEFLGHADGMATIDIRLCCGADNFEKAIIKLANKILKIYGKNQKKRIKKLFKKIREQTA